MLYLTLVMRWIHILGAAILVGAPFIMWLGIYPAAAKLPDDRRDELLEAINKPWRKFLGAVILLQIISGVYWLLVVEHMSQEPPIYQALLGIKMLAAFALFFVLSVLAGRAKAFEEFRRKAPMWIGIAVGLGILTVVCASSMRIVNMHDHRAEWVHMQIGHASIHVLTPARHG
jgi:uncharacterized membrane protein